MTDFSWVQAIGFFLLATGINVLWRSFDPPQKDEVPEVPGLEVRVISRRQIDDGEPWWAIAAKAKRRNPEDDVNPPRIPTKRTR